MQYNGALNACGDSDYGGKIISHFRIMGIHKKRSQCDTKISGVGRWYLLKWRRSIWSVNGEEVSSYLDICLKGFWYIYIKV